MSELNVFSLEDDDYSELFITQQPREILWDVMENDKSDECSSVLGVKPMDFSFPCSSLIKKNDNQHLDISDAEEFENSSQTNTSQM